MHKASTVPTSQKLTKNAKDKNKINVPFCVFFKYTLKIQVRRNMNFLSGEKELNIGCEILVQLIHILAPQHTHTHTPATPTA